MNSNVDHNTIQRQIVIRQLHNRLDECERTGKPITVAAVREYLSAIEGTGWFSLCYTKNTQRKE